MDEATAKAQEWFEASVENGTLPKGAELRKTPAEGQGLYIYTWTLPYDFDGGVICIAINQKTLELTEVTSSPADPLWETCIDVMRNS